VKTNKKNRKKIFWKMQTRDQVIKKKTKKPANWESIKIYKEQTQQKTMSADVPGPTTFHTHTDN
jgi:hypothetical protein